MEHYFAVFCPYCGDFGQPTSKPFKEISYSAIELWELCHARFYFKRVAKRDEPLNQYAEWGKIGHRLGERWLTYGQLPPAPANIDRPQTTEEKMAVSLLAGIPHAPVPRTPGLGVETEIHFEFEGVHFSGFKDAEWSSDTSGAPPNTKRLRGTTALHDWKFVGNFDRVPTPWDFAQAVQPNIYAWDDIRRGAAAVHATNVYMVRGVRSARPVRVLMQPEVVYNRMRELAATGREILHVLETKPPAHELSTNAEACFAFGGVTCPHFEICHVTPEARFLADLKNLPTTQVPPGDLEEMSQSALDAITAAAGFTAPNGATAPATPAPAQATHQLVWHSGQTFKLPNAEVAAAISGGAKHIGPAPLDAPVLAAPVWTPPASTLNAPVWTPPAAQPAPVPNPGAAVNPAPWTPPAVPAQAPVAPPALPPAAAPAQAAAPAAVAPGRPPGTRGRPRAAAAPVAPGAFDYNALADAIIDRIAERLLPSA